MSVCNDKVCDAIVCGEDPCESLIPSICGGTMPITMAECYTGNMRPQSDCLKTELHAIGCNTDTPSQASIKVTIEDYWVEEFDSTDYQIVLDTAVENIGEVNLTNVNLKEFFRGEQKYNRYFGYVFAPSHKEYGSGLCILDDADFELGYITYMAIVTATDPNGNVVTDTITQNLPVSIPE